MIDFLYIFFSLGALAAAKALPVAKKFHVLGSPKNSTPRGGFSVSHNSVRKKLEPRFFLVRLIRIRCKEEEEEVYYPQ